MPERPSFPRPLSIKARPMLWLLAAMKRCLFVGERQPSYFFFQIHVLGEFINS
jgi:hypothetical protein